VCGLAGIFAPTYANGKSRPIRMMTDLMRHRGPDGEGYYESPNGLYSAGFRRLSIIDLETGDQPLKNERGNLVLTGNGEIYNYVELRRKYANYPFKTKGDMEAVLAAYQHEGIGFLKSLNGMFSLAIYDGENHSLLLVRDRLGVKPLYYSVGQDGSVVFASEIKPIFSSGLVTPEIDEAAVSSYMSHGYVPAPKTLFKGVKKIPPGHLVKINAAGELNIERYWRAEGQERLPDDADGVAEYLSELLDDSIKLQMRSDVPIGVLLSGGLDSGLLVALAAQHSEQALKTFTVSFEGAAVDEAPLARLVAERYATEHEEIQLSTSDVADHLPFLAWHAEEPLNDAALLPNYLVEQALGRKVKVALNGTGGDELFAGYGRYFQLPVEQAFLKIPAWVRRKVVVPAIRTLSPERAWKLLRAEKYMTDSGGYIHDHCSHFPPPMRKMIGCSLPMSKPAQQGFADEFEGDQQACALYADINTYLPDDLLTLLDRTSMAVGVEGRVPFLDHRLVNAALSVPPEIRTPGQSQKWLERKMAVKHLPEQILSAPKQGFASPVPAWMKSGLGELAKNILTRPEAIARGWWTIEGIVRLTNNPERHGFRTYSLLMLELAIVMMTERTLGEQPPDFSLTDLAISA
jgi:asparagine synthase (glutamine-hydrolysing)